MSSPREIAAEIIRYIVREIGPPPMPFKQGTEEDCLYSGPNNHGVMLTRGQMEERIREAVHYAVRLSTAYRAIERYDSDGFADNVIVALLGYKTPNGLADDDQLNPEEYRKK